jgi:NTP pyrophosphatase (non-canonical NTP hydrolase)
MELDQYQKAALETAVYPKEYKTIYPALGMNGEAGEVADKMKKVLRDSDVIVRDGNGTIVLPDAKREELAKEVGDVLWYVATMAYDLGYSLGEIAEMNIRKLASRKQRGQLNGSGDNR